MKITFISDTHSKHSKLNIEETDILIHSGDCTTMGYTTEVIDFLDWFSKQKARYKIFIAGNHDWFFQEMPIENINELLSKYPDVIYLNDSSVEIEGLNIHGSPVQPEFKGWAFNRKRGEEIKKHWDMIPDKTDILIVHGPAKGILDLTYRGDSTGCEDLLNKIMEIKPKIFCHGHIHESYGMEIHDDITFINASSILGQMYDKINKPIVIEL